MSPASVNIQIYQAPNERQDPQQVGVLMEAQVHKRSDVSLGQHFLLGAGNSSEGTQKLHDRQRSQEPKVFESSDVRNRDPRKVQICERTLGQQNPQNPPTPTTPGNNSAVPAMLPTPVTPTLTDSQTKKNTVISACAQHMPEFIHVTIHTAKCSVCDKHNKSTMYRCPGCNWQVCSHCMDHAPSDKNPLKHGFDEHFLPPCPPRRNLKDNTSPLIVAPGGGTPSSGRFTRVQQASAITPTKSGRKRNGTAATPRTQATSSREARRKARPLLQVNEDGSEYEEPASPTPKRSKTSMGKSVPSKAGGVGDLAEMTNEALAHVGGEGYSDGNHILSRHGPSTRARVFIPERLGHSKRSFRRKGNKLPTIAKAEGFVRDQVNDRVAENNNSGIPAFTVRDLIVDRSKLIKHDYSISLDDDQEGSLTAAMTEAGRKLILQFKRERPESSKTIGYSLDMRISHLGNCQQQKLEEVVNAKGIDMIEEFEREKDISQDLPRPIEWHASQQGETEPVSLCIAV